MKKMVVIWFLLVILSSFYVLGECGENSEEMVLEAIYEGEDSCSNLLKIILEDTTDEDPGPPYRYWRGYLSVTLTSVPPALSITDETVDLSLTDDSITWEPVTCDTSQAYTIIATLNNGETTCQESLSLPFAPADEPDLTITITPPSKVISGTSTSPYDNEFTINFSNSGSADLTSLNAQASLNVGTETASTNIDSISVGTVAAGQVVEKALTISAKSPGTNIILTITSNFNQISEQATFDIVEEFSINCQDITITKGTAYTYDLNSKCSITGTQETVVWSNVLNSNVDVSIANNQATLTPSSEWSGTTTLTLIASAGDEDASDQITITVPEPAVDLDGDNYDTNEDCNDGDINIHPGMNETCDGIDQNCNQRFDESFDNDSDGFTICGTTTDGTDKVIGVDSSDRSWDCNDANELIFPGNQDPYCDCDLTNLTTKNKESIANEECNDNYDNDCDGDIDEDDSDCEPCNIFDEFNPFPVITIISPKETEFNLKDSINFMAEVDKPEDIKQGQILWEFGDGSQAYTLITNYSYQTAGTYTAEVSIRDKKDCHTSMDEIQLTIIECQSYVDCANNSLCCDNICKTPKCLTDTDCNQDDSLITNIKCENQGCDAYCSWGNCTISCLDDIECNDQDESTIDKCVNPGTCGSRCLHSKKELKIQIISPKNEAVYDTNIVMFEYSTSMEAECEYQLNTNKQKLYTNNFELEAKPGTNNLKLFCNGKTAVARFTVKAETNLMGDLTGETEESFFDFLKKKPLIKATEEQITTLLGKIIKDEGVGYELNRELNLKDNQSIIKLGLKNIKTFLALKNVELMVTIPKEIVNNASQIKSSQEFTIVEADPIIKHTMPNINTGSSETISYTVSKEITEELLNQIVAEVKIADVTDEDIEGIKEKIEETQKATEITKKITKEAGKTTVTTTIVPKGVLTNAKVFLDIPKCMAEKLNEIAFKNKNYKVISDDPLIVWHFTELSNKIDLSYEISKDIDVEDCEKQSVILALAEQIEAMERGSSLATSYWKLILAALIVPVVGFGIVYFHKFSGKDEGLEDVVERTAEIIKEDLETGRYKEEDLKLALYKRGWNSKMIEKVFRKAK